MKTLRLAALILFSPLAQAVIPSNLPGHLAYFYNEAKAEFDKYQETDWFKALPAEGKKRERELSDQLFNFNLGCTIPVYVMWKKHRSEPLAQELLICHGNFPNGK